MVGEAEIRKVGRRLFFLPHIQRVEIMVEKRFFACAHKSFRHARRVFAPGFCGSKQIYRVVLPAHVGSERV